MDVKTRILESAIKLFNEKGVGNVTLRLIAQDLGMSCGNLNYHFKKRKHILEAILGKWREGQSFDSLEAYLAEVYNKRCLWVDRTQIVRETPRIKSWTKSEQVFLQRRFNIPPEGWTNILTWLEESCYSNKQQSQWHFKRKASELLS